MSEIYIIDSFEKFDKIINIYGTFEKPLFLAKEIGEIFEIVDIRTTFRTYPSEWLKTHRHRKPDSQGPRNMTFITESALYKLIMRSDKPEAVKFQKWMCEDVLPAIRKNGEYKIIHKYSKNLTFQIYNEFDLHKKIVQFIKKRYSHSLFNATLGEMQDTPTKRLKAFEQGYIKGSPDLIIFNKHIKFSGLVIEFKTPNGKGKLTDSQIKILHNFKINNFKTLLSNDYDEIVEEIIEYFREVRINCEYCKNKFKNEKSLNNHYNFFHKIKN